MSWLILPTYIIRHTVSRRQSRVKITPINTIKQLIFETSSDVTITWDSSKSLTKSCIIMFLIYCALLWLWCSLAGCLPVTDVYSTLALISVPGHSAQPYRGEHWHCTTLLFLGVGDNVNWSYVCCVMSEQYQFTFLQLSQTFTRKMWIRQILGTVYLLGMLFTFQEIHQSA